MGWVVVQVVEMERLHVSCFGRLRKLSVLSLLLFSLQPAYNNVDSPAHPL